MRPFTREALLFEVGRGQAHYIIEHILSLQIRRGASIRHARLADGLRRLDGCVLACDSERPLSVQM